MRAILVDDERLARNTLRMMLEEYPVVDIVGEAESISNAILLIEKYDPDVIFLDIQLYGESGFDLLAQMDIHCHIVFVTAHDEHAIRAFNVNATDYLLKPVEPERLQKTIERLSTKRVTIQEDPAPKETNFEYDDNAFIQVDGNLKVVKIDTIKYIKAQGYASILYYSDNRSGFVIKTLKDWEKILPPKHFVRIHRSTLINLEYVDKTEKWFNYTYRIFIRGVEEPLVMSRRYTAKLKRTFKNK